MDLRIERENFFEDGNDIGLVVSEAKVREVCVCLAWGQIVIRINALIHVGSSDTDAQITQTDAVSLNRKELSQNGRSFFRCHADQKLSTSTGECEPEANHRLK